MGKSKIQWTERTWNPVTGCSKISQGCVNCYAEVMSRRLKGMGQKKYQNGFRLSLHEETLSEPTKTSNPSMFFVCSMGDLFHKDVPFEFINKVMATIDKCPQHTFQILTKRPYRMASYFRMERDVPENVWIGTTVECAETVHRIEEVRSIGKYNTDGTKVRRFLSCEPLLSDLGDMDLKGIDLVIVGGESGQNARPMDKRWVLNIKRQCDEQGVVFFFKQWGTWGEDGVKRSKYANGSMLEGREWKEYPETKEE